MNYTSIKHCGFANYQSDFFGELNNCIDIFSEDCKRYNAAWGYLIEENTGKILYEYKRKLNFIPINDGHGIIGYNWLCACGKTIEFVSPKDMCSCGFVVPDVDPNVWYNTQMNKPEELRDWNIK